MPRLGQKILAVLTAVVVVAGAYYDIVIPGWRPAPRLAPPWSWLVFGVLASVVTIGVTAFVVFK